MRKVLRQPCLCSHNGNVLVPGAGRCEATSEASTSSQPNKAGDGTGHAKVRLDKFHKIRGTGPWGDQRLPFLVQLDDPGYAEG
jgi:hypothetical protein